MLNFLEPPVTVPSGMVNWNAIWKVSTTKEINKLIIGDMNCNRFELHPPADRDAPTNLNDDEQIQKDKSEYIPCQVSEIQQAGVYDVDSETTFGDLYKMSSVKQVLADGSSEYDFAITAEIKSINQNTGGDQGNQLEIVGLGFG